MNIRKHVLIAASLFATSLTISAQIPNLPRVEILGKEYFYHEVKKGESLYGIARQYGWNAEELYKLNPNASHDLKKGTRLYYPTGRVDVKSETEIKEETPTDFEPITHIVKKGENIYTISRLYNISLDTLYAANPSAKLGVKTGDKIVISQSPSSGSNKYIYYVIKPGDTLYSLANQYKTTIEDILKANPGVSENNFRSGETIRVAVNSSVSRIHTEFVEEERLASIDSYKAKKNDTWASISQRTGVDEITLKEANEAIDQPKKDAVINVPQVETVKIEKHVSDADPREQTPEGIREMYDSIHRVDSDIARLETVNVAILLDDPNSKKDIDFTRGFLLALDEMKDSSFKTNIKVVDGRGAPTTITEELDAFEPNILIATADKAFPAFLADYGETNHMEVINVFDVKNDLYEENPSMIQILPPSSLFNEQIADRISSDFGEREILMVGVADGNDAIADLLIQRIEGEDKVKKMSVHSLSDFNLNESKSYLIYSFGQKKEDMQALLTAVSDLRERFPLADMTIVGRPSWVTLTDLFQNKFHDAEIVVPARCWLDSESKEGKDFEDKFNDVYGQTPVRSFPNFAASGYDIANYFINATVSNGGDFNRPTPNGSGVQSDFSLDRVSNWGGFMNPMVYLLKFKPSGAVQKISLK